MEVVVLIIYALAMTFIFLYSIIQIQLVYHYLKKKPLSNEAVVPSNWPFISIQLPIYNERYVVERLIKSVAELDYPRDRMEIQVLDDSDDGSSELISQFIATLPNDLIVQHIQRKERSGFKAGALAYGLNMAKGEYTAIFDADFVPEKDFLKKSVPHFSDEGIGMIQARWAHLNKDYSLLTKLQSFGLDAHFTVEQLGRNKGGHFINFNGTAGIWRNDCIRDAGGWQSDTLTEDLDLSYRAQLKGWKFKFLEHLGAPAELPAQMNALKTQQYRWTKGAAECTRKNLLSVLRSDSVSFSSKLNAIFHLLNSSVFICIVLVSILSIPILYIKQAYPEYRFYYQLAGIFILGVFFLSVFYLVSFFRIYGKTPKSFFRFLLRFPMFLSVSMGLSLHNGIAAVEGLIGRKSPFIRTPKFNIRDKMDGWKNNIYLNKRIGKLTILEILLAAYFAYGLYLSFQFQDFGLTPFLLMLCVGYAIVSFLSIRHALS